MVIKTNPINRNFGPPLVFNVGCALLVDILSGRSLRSVILARYPT
jgi:hypothetical protein